MSKTQPEPVRDQQQDHLLTPSNCVVALIDYQPEQYQTVGSATRERIDLNVVTLCKAATKFGVPVVLSTVGVDMGVNTGTADVIRSELPGVEEIDRTGVNAWEDVDFRDAIASSERRKVVMAESSPQVLPLDRPGLCRRAHAQLGSTGLGQHARDHVVVLPAEVRARPRRRVGAERSRGRWRCPNRFRVTDPGPA